MGTAKEANMAGNTDMGQCCKTACSTSMLVTPSSTMIAVTCNHKGLFAYCPKTETI